MTEADRALLLTDFAAGGVPDFHYADGACGIRGVDGATAFPSALTLASSFDVELAERYGRMLGRELVASGFNVLLAPALDIARDPYSGRLGENLGEDPMLAGVLGGRIARGIQSCRAIALAKHYVGNNLEVLRTGEGPGSSRTDAVDVIVDDRALHEVYLEPFRRAVVDYGAAGILGSYNRLNGEYVCQSRRLLDLPREQWDFAGVYTPDFLFAVRDIPLALDAGLDLPALGDGASGRTAEMVDSLPEARVAELAEHVRTAARMVDLVAPTRTVHDEDLATPAALRLAFEVAVEGAVLLRNDGSLPLPAGSRVAIIGADELTHRLVVGGAAGVTVSEDRVADLEAEFARQGAAVTGRAAGAANVPAEPIRSGEGVRVRARVERDGDVELLDLDSAVLAAESEPLDAEWSAELELDLDSTEASILSLDLAGEAVVEVNGVEVARGFREASPMIAGPAYPLQVLLPRTEESRRSIVVRYRTGPALGVAPLGLVPRVAASIVPLAPIVDAALAATADADVVVMLAGRVTGEAMDAESLELPGGQGELIEALAEAGRRVVVLTHGSGPIVVPWLDRASAVLHLGHPGEQVSQAVAALLMGAVEPGGRLPISWPEKESDVPIPPGARRPDAEGRLRYDDGVDIGYRAYERAGIEPAFAFGHGLGYAAFTLDAARPLPGAVEVDLRCGADRGGKSVVQLFARRAPGETLALVGIGIVRVPAGGSATVQIPVDRHAASRYDADSGAWISPTVLDVQVGFSRADLRATVPVEW